MAVDVGLRQALGRRLDRVGALVHQAELIVLPFRERTIIGADRQVAFEIEPGAGCAEQVAAIERQQDAFAGRGLGGLGLQVECDAVRDVIFNKERGLADGVAIGIGQRLDAPGSALRRRVDGEVMRVSARAHVGNRRREILDAIGPFDHEGHRQAGHGVGLLVAQQHGCVHGFATAIDAALGVDESIDGARRRTPLNAAIRQVEGGLRQVDEAVVAVSRLRNDESCSRAAFAVLQACFEDGRARGIGLGRCQNFVVAGNEAHINTGHGVSGRNRARADMQPVLAAHGGQPQVRDDEPLRGDGVVVLGLARAGLGRHHIEAGLQLAHRLIDGEGGGDVLIERRGRFHRAFPDELALLVGDVIGAVAIDLGAEVGAHHIVDQVAVADAVKRQLGFLAVDRDQRNAVLAGARQHIALAREADGGVTVAHIEIEREVLRHRVVGSGGQALAGGHRIALTVLQAFDAELGSLGGDSGDGARLLREIGGEIGDGARDRLRHLEAGARRIGIAIDLVVGHAEAVVDAHCLVGLADFRHFDELEALLVGHQRRAPVFALGEALRHDVEGLGLVLCAAHHGIGLEARADHFRGNAVAVRIINGRRGGKLLGELQPQRAIGRALAQQLLDRGGGEAGVAGGFRRLDVGEDFGFGLLDLLGEFPKVVVVIAQVIAELVDGKRLGRFRPRHGQHQRRETCQQQPQDLPVNSRPGMNRVAMRRRRHRRHGEPPPFLYPATEGSVRRRPVVNGRITVPQGLRQFGEGGGEGPWLLGLRLVVVLQYAPGSAFEIVVLAGLQRPDEGAKPDHTHEQGNGDQIQQSGHAAFLRPVRPGWLSWPDLAEDRGAVLPRPTRSALAMTMIEEVDMAIAATSGETSPAMASGTANTL